MAIARNEILRAKRHSAWAFSTRWTAYNVRNRIVPKIRCPKACGERITLIDRFDPPGSVEIVRVAGTDRGPAPCGTLLQHLPKGFPIGKRPRPCRHPLLMKRERKKYLKNLNQPETSRDLRLELHNDWTYPRVLVKLFSASFS